MSSTIPTPDEAFKEFTRRLGGVLRRHSFKGSGQNFRRDAGAQWQAINIQKSQWRVDRDDPIMFYVNIGLQFPNFALERLAPPPAAVSKFTAIKADQILRVGDAFPDMRLDWFGVDGRAFDPFWERFSELLTAHLLPALDAMSTPRGLANVARAAPWLVTPGTRAFVGPSLAPPRWDPKDRDAGLWKQDAAGCWWGPGEW